MSTWIHITNLPLYYDDYGLQEIFTDIGQITATNVTKQEMILKSTGFVQFANAKHAKLAASKKDQTVIANSAVRVYLIWTQNEDLSTIKVTNIEPQSTESDLEKYFDPYGGIVDIRIIKPNQSSSNKDDEKIKEESNEPYALISFCRVDYALQAVQEMNGTIIGMCGALKVELVNPDARNLKWKRNSFEYILLPIPEINEMNQYQHHGQHHHRNHNKHSHRHRSHRHHHQNYNNHQYQHQQHNNNNNQPNPNIIIVNNIGAIHNNTNINDDDSKNNQLLHPSYRRQGGNNGNNGNRNDSHYRRHQNFNGDKQHHRPHSHSPNTSTSNTRGRGRDRRYRQQHHDRYNNHNDNDYTHRHNRHQRHNNHNNDDQKPRKARKYRSNRSNPSTLLGPLYNSSNGQYRTYSVTPSPTRSPNIADNDNNNNNNPSLQRMNSSDSTSSNGSAHSLPGNYNNHFQHKRRALDHYGLPSKSHHHSPQPFQPQQIQQQQVIQSPVSPATTVSTPSTTHSQPTPTGYTHTQTLLSRSKTPTGLSIPTPTVLSNSSTTPVSTPPSAQTLKFGLNVNPVFTPQLNVNGLNTLNMNNVNMNNMNNMNMMNNINGITNSINALNMNVNNLNTMVSPTSLSLPLGNMNNNNNQYQPHIPQKSPQSVTSPILITPQQSFMIQQQMLNGTLPNNLPQCNATNAKTTPVVISPPNTQQPFVFSSPPTLLGPLNTPPQPQKKFVFNNNGNNNNLTPTSNTSNGSGSGGGSSSSKKGKKSPSHSWTKEEEELGNKLYKIVSSKYPQRATKIVGMLLKGHTKDDLKFMMDRANILMPLAKDYKEQIQQREMSKKK